MALLMTETNAVRIDKWLWAARFYKTRSLATDAIDAGHVRRASVGSVSGDRLKPAHTVRIGETYAVQRGDMMQQVLVTRISERRGSASDAALLYRETEESLATRLEQQALHAAADAAMGGHGAAQFRGRPTKQDRRKLADMFAKNYAPHSHQGSPDGNE